GRDLAEADRANFPGLDVPRELADGFLDRDSPVEPVHVIDVDVIDPEPFQRPFQAFADVLGAVVELALAVGLPANGEFGRERDFASPAAVLGQEPADQRLARAVAVNVGGVPEIDSELERPRKRPHRLAFGRRPIKAAEAHAAEADRRNRSVPPKAPPLHRPPFLQMSGPALTAPPTDVGRNPPTWKRTRASPPPRLRSPRRSRGRDTCSRNRSYAIHRSRGASAPLASPAASSSQSATAPGHGRGRRFHRRSRRSARNGLDLDSSACIAGRSAG